MYSTNFSQSRTAGILPFARLRDTVPIVIATAKRLSQTI